MISTKPPAPAACAFAARADPHESSPLPNQLLGVGVFALRRSAGQAQRPHGCGVDSVSTALDRVEAESLASVDDVPALVHSCTDEHVL